MKPLRRAPWWLLAVSLLVVRVAHALPATYEQAQKQAQQLEKKQAWDELLAMLDHAEKLAAREHGSDSEEVLVARFQRAKLLGATGHHDEAIRLLESSIAAMDAKTGSFEARIGRYHQLIAEYHGDAGRLADKQATLARAVERLQKAQFAGRERVLVETMTHLAAASLELGRFEAAADVARRAVTIADAKSEPALAVGPLTTLGAAQQWAWDFRGSRESYRRALTLAVEHLGETHPTTGTILYQTAALHARVGDTRASIAAVERALSIYREAHGEMSVQVAAATLNLGGQWLDHGDLERALTLSKAARDKYVAILGADSVHIGHANLVVGRTQRALGRWPRAEATLTSARQRLTKHYGDAHPWAAYAQEQLAELALLRGDPDAAVGHATEALAARAKSEGPDSPSRSTALELVGRAALAQRDGQAALPHLRAALKLRRSAFGDVNPDVATTHCGLAIAHGLAGDDDAALEQQRLCDEGRDKLMGHALNAGSDAQKRRYLEALDVATNQAVALHQTLLPAHPVATELALTSVLRRKGRALDVMAAQYGIARRVSDADRPAFDRLAAARRRLATLLYAGATPDVVAQARERAHALERELANEALVAPADLRIDAVRAALPDDGALVELVVFGTDQLSPARADPNKRAYAAYVLGKTGPPRAVKLGSAREVNRAVSGLREALASRQKDPAPAARALFRRVFAPIEPLLQAATRVFIAADGKLSLVPFAALMDGDDVLLRRYRFSYLTSGRDLVAAPGTSRVAGPPVLLGAPDFGPTSPGAKLSFPALPATADEIAALEKVLPNAVARMGASADEAAIKALRGPEILHVATHGFFLPDMGTGAASTTERGAVLTTLPEASRVDPWLHSGMAFAGANVREGEEDGLLSAYEAATLDLDGTKLVVLSACDTGVGATTRGEGVLGLRRAFVLAGAETVVMSLWRVDDASTRDLMLSYYARLTEGLGRAEAMRRAQLAMLEQPATRDPYFWSAFIVEGDASPLREAVAPAEAPKGARGCHCTTPGGSPAQAPPGTALLAALGLALGLGLGSRRRRGR